MSEIEKKICIIDYGSGNIGSVSNVLNKLNLNYCVSNSIEDFKNSSHFILPGVGSFGSAMKKLNQSIDIDKLEYEILNNKKPILGICVGMQLMAEFGYEFGKSKGLGWIKGNVEIIKTSGLILPHIGWNSVKVKKDNSLLNNEEKNKDFYFVNSYYFDIENNDQVIATTEYGMNFPSIISFKNIYGVQFHPEKSQKPGKKLIFDFINSN